MYNDEDFVTKFLMLMSSDTIFSRSCTPGFHPTPTNLPIFYCMCSFTARWFKSTYERICWVVWIEPN